jgi:hypothetical protein
LQISLHFFRSFHAIGKVHASTGQSALSKLLQFKEFSVLSVEFTRSGCHVSSATTIETF